MIRGSCLVIFILFLLACVEISLSQNLPSGRNTDFNPCLYPLFRSKCSENAKCIDRSYGYSCECLPGYEDLNPQSPGRNCKDIDECEIYNGGCGSKVVAICTNLPGNRSCSCNPGFTTQPGALPNCKDIDECDVDNGGCGSNVTAICRNAFGSYSCSCEKGYGGAPPNCTEVTCPEVPRLGLNCSGNNLEDTCTMECPDGSSPLANDQSVCRRRRVYDDVTVIGIWVPPTHLLGECPDIDECVLETHNCDENANCTNTNRSFTCECFSGFGGNGTACTDINECDTDNGGCGPNETANCTNLPGSRSCSCNVGFTGIPPNCTDIDECDEGLHYCHDKADCTNTPGRFTCTCKEGFTGDGKICTDIDECAEINGGCGSPTTAFCNNSPGNFTCACLPGFTGSPPKCTDIDECDLETHNCEQNANCTNTNGSFTCTCLSGFRGNGSDCTDIDECNDIDTPHKCDVNANCINTERSFHCTCKTGYTGQGNTCIDIDECDEGYCHGDAECSNNPGSFTCNCLPGFRGNNGTDCTDVNECGASELNNCSENATCNNSAGNYKCECLQGFADLNSASPGTNCQDIDECNETDIPQNCHVNANCINTEGSFNCTCKTGYTGDGKTCTDIDECTERLDDCHDDANCINIPGSFNCTCKQGFTGNGVFCTAITCDPSRTDPTNGNVSCTNTNQYGSVCTYNCNDGYALSNNRLLNTTCNDDGDGDGEWSSVHPICTATTCDLSRTDPTNGNISCTNTNQFGSVCTYTCNDGYALSNNSLRNTFCNDDVDSDADGEWSSVPPTCTAITCDPSRTDPTHGNVSCTNTNQYGSVCTYTCNEGYALSNSSLRTTFCYDYGDADGEWTSVPPECRDIDECTERLDDCHDDANCINIPASFNCTCKQGFTGNGVICTAITCNPSRIVPTNGNVSCTNTNQFGSVCTYTCNEGYALSNNSLRTTFCYDYGDADGEWFSVPPECTDIINLNYEYYNFENIERSNPTLNSDDVDDLIRGIEILLTQTEDSHASVSNTNSIPRFVDKILFMVELSENNNKYVSPPSEILRVGAAEVNLMEEGGLSFSLVGGFDNENVGPTSPQITLPRSIPLSGMVRVAFTAFQDATLFATEEATSVSSTGELDLTVAAGKPQIINSIVIGASVMDTDLNNLKDPIVIRLTPHATTVDEAALENNTAIRGVISRPRCVFFDYNLANGSGDWSSEGCNTTVNEDGTVTCECDHLTSFAILMDVDTVIHDYILESMSYVGAAMSIFSLIITIVTYLGFRTLRAFKSKKILVHFCFALLGLYITYTIGLAGKIPSNQSHCIATGFFMQYFLTAVFVWMFVEVLDMYILFVKVWWSSIDNYVEKMALLGWGAPLILSVATLAAHFIYASNAEVGEDFTRIYPQYSPLTTVCWVTTYGLYYAILVPLGLILAVNCILFSLVIYNVTCQRARKGSTSGRRSSGTHIKAKQHLINALAILLLSGPTWIFGFLINIDPVADGAARRVLSYVFVIFNSLQGLWIFIVFCARPRKVRKLWTGVLCSGITDIDSFSTITKTRPTASSPSAAARPVTRGIFNTGGDNQAYASESTMP